MNSFLSTIRGRLIVYLLGASLLSLSINIWYFLNKRSSTFEKAKAQINMQAERASLEVSQELARDMGIVQGLKYAFIHHEQERVAEKDRVLNPMILTVLEENNSYLGVWYSMELAQYDPQWGQKPGRRSVSYYRNSDRSVGFKIDTLDLGGVKKFTGYHRVKEARKDAIMEPYWCDYTKEGHEQFLETTLASPVLQNGEFTGLVGIDLELESFKELVRKTKLLNVRFAFLLSNNGTYVSHPDDTIVGMTFAEVNPAEDKSYQVTERVKKGEKIEFLTNYDISGEQIYALFVPLKIGDTETPWSLGVVAMKSEITRDLMTDLRNSILISLAGLLILIAVMIWFSTRLTAPIRSGVELAQLISDGDLSARMKNDSRDEIGLLINTLGSMAERLKGIIVQFRESIQNLSSMSERLNENSADLSMKTDQQAEASSRILGAVEKVTENMRSNSASARETERIAEKSVESVQSSNRSSKESIETLKTIEAKISVITDIAFQTNILALNAAVESARAGEHGKGFAVVASEVRKLAERSKLAAEEITQFVGESVKASELTGEKLDRVTREIGQILKLVKAITQASVQQDTGISEINREVNDLDLIAQNNASTAQNLARNAQELSALSDELNQIVAYFRV
ncbi:MAG: methyl-accepting chemotaxis protein [Bacteroidales bacterium]